MMSGGSSSNQQQQSTSTNTINPQEMAMLQGNYATAQQNAASLTPYTGQTVAGFNPTQIQAQGILTNIAADPSYQANNSAALSGVQGILSNPFSSAVTPTPVSAGTISSTPVTAGQLANTDLSPYLNPYTSDVINASIARNEQARRVAQTNDSQQATAANAFGGSRSGVEAALTNGQYDLNDQANIANLNAQNFAQAQAAATGDINRTLGAAQFNSTGALNAAQANQNAALNAGEFNAGQNLSAQQDSFNNALASAGLTLNAAGQLVALNNDALGTATQQAGLLSSVGDAQQNQEQAQLTAAYNAYLQGLQLTVQQQQLLNSALGMIPIEQTTNSSGTSSGKTTTTPGLTDILNSASKFITPFTIP